VLSESQAERHLSCAVFSYTCHDWSPSRNTWLKGEHVHPWLPQIRDEAITAGFQLFKAKGLVPANADSDSDDVNYAEAAGNVNSSYANTQGSVGSFLGHSSDGNNILPPKSPFSATTSLCPKVWNVEQAKAT